MINDIIKLIIRFAALLALQVLILNNIQISGFINPYLYVLFILLLPVKFSRIAVLILAFITGISIDTFTNTSGMHAAATVFMAFVRPSVLSFFAPRDSYEADAQPGLKDFGFQWFFIYSATLVVIHHLVLFFTEVFRFNEFFDTFLRAMLSAAATLVLILITQFLFGKARIER